MNIERVKENEKSGKRMRRRGCRGKHKKMKWVIEVTEKERVKKECEGKKDVEMSCT